jgi:hypothetical protein
MLYLHDVWVNWFEGEENSYNICSFHEWRKEDTVELLDQVPLLKLDPVLFHYIENDLLELPSSLLEEVYKKAYIRKNHERIPMDYCFVATDGTGIIAIDTIGYSIPIRKSRLIPRQEQLAYEMIQNVEPIKYDYASMLADFKKKEYHILSPSPTIMLGLTRRERQLKQLLFMALDQLKNAGNTSEVRYWYTEWAPEEYANVLEMSFEDIWGKLFNEMKHGWTDKHAMLCERMIKGQPFFEKLWEMEVGDRPSML